MRENQWTWQRGTAQVEPTTWSTGLSVPADGTGVLARSGSVAIRLLAEPVGLTQGRSGSLARRSFVPIHDRGRPLPDVAVLAGPDAEYSHEVDTIEILAVAAACLVAVVVAFQLALVAGAPWAAAAYGGRVASSDGTLPAKYRVASVIAGVVLLSVLWLILAAGGAIGRGSVPDRVLNVGAWVLAGVFLLNTLGNLRGRHPLERWGFGAITAVLAVLCAAIAVYR